MLPKYVVVDDSGLNEGDDISLDDLEIIEFADSMETCLEKIKLRCADLVENCDELPTRRNKFFSKFYIFKLETVVAPTLKIRPEIAFPITKEK